MPRFGQAWFNGGYFGDKVLAYTPFKGSIKRIPLGFKIRRDFGKQIIFRVMTGNGYYGTKEGEKIQQKYKYFVPSSINNPEGAASRAKFAAAVASWQGMTNEQKANYNLRASYKNALSGYNLYIKEYMRT